jgi:EAL domain-containing protein (putative c-di-GMP-specific phosphodiesterase class I)
MSYQRALLELEELESEEDLAPIAQCAPLDEPRVETCLEPIWFQPIVDTFEHRFLAYDCVVRDAPYDDAIEAEVMQSAIRSIAIHSATEQVRQGLYFVNLIPSSIGDPEIDMRSTAEAIFDSGMEYGNVVFEILESDLARDPVHSRFLRKYLQSNGFGFALSGAGVGAGVCSFQAVSDFAPDYIKLDRRLTRHMSQQACAPAIGKLVQMAEKSGARVIAEGVDRVRMVENLWLLGVQFMQGHLFGDPSLQIA